MFHVHVVLYNKEKTTEFINSFQIYWKKNIPLVHSVSQAGGVELIHLIRLALSVLNRLLILRPSDAPLSPVELSLSAQPAGSTNQHIIAVIAQYIYHRHDPRLPTLSTLLLKRLAIVSLYIFYLLTFHITLDVFIHNLRFLKWREEYIEFKICSNTGKYSAELQNFTACYNYLRVIKSKPNPQFKFYYLQFYTVKY